MRKSDLANRNAIISSKNCSSVHFHQCSRAVLSQSSCAKNFLFESFRNDDDDDGEEGSFTAIKDLY